MLRLLVLALAALLLQTSCDAKVYISSTVRLYSNFRGYHKFCSTQLARARAAGSISVNINPTQHFRDSNGDYYVDQYCYAPGKRGCTKVTRKARKEYEQVMFKCIRKAWAMGFREIELTPHINDGFNGVWRNLMKVNPLQRIKGYSYYDAYLAPLISAANRALPSSATVYFNLQGEMNGALIVFPGEWRAVGKLVRSKLKFRNKHVGANLNFNKFCPWCDEWANWKPSFSGNQRFDTKKIQSFFSSLDFIGTSAYHPTWFAGDSYAYVTPGKLEASLFVLAEELSWFGVNLKALNDRGTEIQYCEFGVGGATCENAVCPAQSSDQVAKYPFFGVSGSYNPNADPWKVPDNQRYRRDFYKAAIQYAASYGKNSWKVTHIFNWNDGSYDCQGINPASTNKYGSWKDPVIAGWITAYNTRGAVPSR